MCPNNCDFPLQGGRIPKGTVAKSARAAALLFSKRVLARVRNFDAGQSCITDPALRDLLFCVASKVPEPACGALVDGDKKVASSAAVADRTIINSSPPSKLTGILGLHLHHQS